MVSSAPGFATLGATRVAYGRAGGERPPGCPRLRPEAAWRHATSKLYHCGGAGFPGLRQRVERVSREIFTVCACRPSLSRASAPASSSIVRPLRCQQKRPHAISAGRFYGFTLTAPRTANVRTRSPLAGGGERS
jgi:hypothetical protein